MYWQEYWNSEEQEFWEGNKENKIMERSEKRTCHGEMRIEYFIKGMYSNEKAIYFSNLSQLLKEFEKFYKEVQPLTYKILRYCTDWSYYSKPENTKWYFQQRNVAEQPKEEHGYSCNPEYISGLYFILEQHLFDKGLK